LEIKITNINNIHLSDDCLICGTILTGIGGRILSFTGLKRSDVNPNICNRCNMHIQDGKTCEVSILFVDLCSFTEITHMLGPDKTHRLVDQFLKEITDAVLKNYGVIDKYLGDAAMALFNVPIQKEFHAELSLKVVNQLKKIMPNLSKEHDVDLNFSAGLALGAVRVGKLGSKDIKDFTVIGDAVNRSARLQAQANPGEIVLDIGAFSHVKNKFSDIKEEKMSLKGFPSEVSGYRININSKSSGITENKIKNTNSRNRFPAYWSVILALFASPCIAGAALSPGAIVLAFGALSGSSLSSLSSTPYVVDQWFIRLPFMFFACLAIGINFYMIYNARKVRKTLLADGIKLELTIKEKRIEKWVIILSLIAISVICFEFISHHFVMRFTLL